MKAFSKIGFVGCGKMACAIIKGITKSKFVDKKNIIASKSSSKEMERFAKELKIKITLDNKEVVKKSDVIFIAVKPAQVEVVLNEIKDYLISDKLIVSVAAGVTTKFIESILDKKTHVIRVMPNTPVLVNEGMSGICGGKFATKTDLKYIEKMLASIGKCIIVNEEQMDIVTAISGSGPAFIYKVINEIARAGEELGLDYEKALLLSIQTAIGAGKMALNKTISMEELISNVATKGGCTAVGVDCMNEYKTKKLFYDVVKSTADKAKTLGK